MAATRPVPSLASPAEVAAELRGALVPLLQTVAGTPPRPVRLVQALGLDKSLASRLVIATRSDSDDDFLHQVPSPTGLRILLQRTEGVVDESLRRDLAAAVQRFETLLDTLPGGRQALDAHLGQQAPAIRDRREAMARQAAFKSVSFLFGHYGELLTTALFLRPGDTPGTVDAMEVHRRVGLQRLAPGMALPLLSVHATAPAVGDPAAALAPLGGPPGSQDPSDYLLPEGCTPTHPALERVTEAALCTFVLPADLATLPARLTTAWRVLRAAPLAPPGPWLLLRNHLLHSPCRTLVRDVFLADGLWPGARPEAAFSLPGPAGTPPVFTPPDQPSLRRINLNARFDALPPGDAGFELPAQRDHGGLLRLALQRAGWPPTAWRGWRCEMAYPVPLVEMQVGVWLDGR